MRLGIVFGALYPNALQAAAPLISEALSGAVALPSLEYAISLHRQVFSEGRQEPSPNVLILHPLLISPYLQSLGAVQRDICACLSS